jgi:iron(III) transport system substrate-binding protein
MALPLFGTTATHVAALYVKDGAEVTRALLVALREAGVRFVDGNSVVRDMVADGRLAYGLTDTDDACAALERDADGRLEIIFVDQAGAGTLVIPNTVGLVADGPNPAAGRAFIDWLLRPATTARLVEDGWFQVALRDLGDAAPAPCVDASDLRLLAVELSAVAAAIEDAQRDMGEVFLR